MFDVEKLFLNCRDHIFAKGHVRPDFETGKGMLMKLGNSQEEVFNKVVNVIKHVDGMGLLKEGTNQIRVTVNGIPTIIKVHIDQGIVLGINAFTGTKALVKEHLIDLVDKIF